MALTRSFLRGLKLDEDTVNAIIEAHTETVNGLKEENSSIQKKLDEAKTALSTKETELTDKYKTLETEYNTYKDAQTKQAAKAAKESAYRKLLKEAGVSDKRLDAIVKIDGEVIDKIEFDKNGAVKGASDITAKVKTDWADFIVASGSQGANVETPPAGDTGKAAFDAMTLSEKMKFANEHPNEYATYSK